MDGRMQKTLTSILDLGEMMLEAGAEVSRVEDTISRLGHAYGFVRTDTFTIINSIVVTMHDADGGVYTETRRIQSIGTDMERICECNALSRRVCAEEMPQDEFAARIDRIEASPRYPEWALMLFWGMTSAAFTVLFGGNAGDMAVSFGSAVLLRIMVFAGIRSGLQNFVLYLLNSFVGGLLIMLVTSQSAYFSYDKIAMGNIMLLIPGIALTTAIRDMLKGDLLSGTMEISGTLVQAAAIAVGFAAVALLW